MLKFRFFKEKRIELYIAAVLVPSIILGVFALWALIRQDSLMSYQLRAGAGSPVFALAMIIFALLLILLIGGYLSTHDMQRQLEVAKLKSDFVSNVSHELKTPLTSIRLLAERLLKLKPEETAKQREYHNLILTQSHQLSHLIANILDFSKLEQQGRESYKPQKLDLGGLVKQAIADYPVNLIRPDCKLEVTIAPELPLCYLDREAIMRALTNLLDNALKFSPAAGTIRISVARVKNAALIEVSDQGPGIAEREQQRIFERFYHTGKGTGLGLTLVRHIAEIHKGRVELKSEPGKGSIFRMVLPYAKDIDNRR